MEREINLLGETKKRQVSELNNLPLFGGSIALFFIVVFATIGITIYSYTLNKQKDTINADITKYENEIVSLKDVEEKKSVVTLKVDELEKIYNKRFDYVKAIDDIQKLFSYTLQIDTIDLKDDKSAIVEAKKTGSIVISESQALTTDIKDLTLKLKLGSSSELQETVDNLKSFLGKGLTRADVKDSSKLEDEEGYEVDFLLTFGSLDTKTEGGTSQ